MSSEKLDRTGALTLKKTDSCLQKHYANWYRLYQIVSARKKKKSTKPRKHHFQNKTFGFIWNWINFWSLKLLRKLLFLILQFSGWSQANLQNLFASIFEMKDQWVTQLLSFPIMSQCFMFQWFWNQAAWYSGASNPFIGCSELQQDHGLMEEHSLSCSRTLM